MSSTARILVVVAVGLAGAYFLFRATAPATVAPASLGTTPHARTPSLADKIRARPPFKAIV